MDKSQLPEMREELRRRREAYFAHSINPADEWLLTPEATARQKKKEQELDALAKAIKDLEDESNSGGGATATE